MSLQARFRLAHPGFALDVDLTLPGRGVSALFGPSGCGKTSVLRCMAGLTRAEGGYCSVNDEVWQSPDIFRPTHQRAVGYVFQDASLFAHLSVRGNLAYGESRVPVRQRRVDRATVVDMLGIGTLLDRMPQGLSGGERQRVAIARALLTSPRLLLMDEPLAALDAARKNEFLPYLERLHDELDMPVVYVSHAPDEVARLADTLVVMESGRVLAAGPLAATLGRLDLPMQAGDDAGVVLHGEVVERDAPWHLIRVALDSGSLWVRDGGQPLGRPVRLRILARDVSVAREPAHASSIQNCLPAIVEEMGTDGHPAQCLVRLSVGTMPVLARLTRRAAHQLALAPGAQVWVQLKAVALIG